MEIIKTTSPEGKQAAYDIRQMVFVDEQKVPMELEIDEFEDEAIHFVCYIDKMPVGACRLRLLSEYGKLERIAVLAPYRGQSIGSSLIHRMEAVIVAEQRNTAKLNAQTHATHFYESLGYHIISEPFVDAGISHVTMMKQLNR